MPIVGGGGNGVNVKVEVEVFVALGNGVGVALGMTVGLGSGVVLGTGVDVADGVLIIVGEASGVLDGMRVGGSVAVGWRVGTGVSVGPTPIKSRGGTSGGWYWAYLGKFLGNGIWRATQTRAIMTNAVTQASLAAAFSAMPRPRSSSTARVPGAGGTRTLRMLK